ncbi:MAG: flagellar hook-basal body complex protein FliE [Solirubrobacteraceae bacterium]
MIVPIDPSMVIGPEAAMPSVEPILPPTDAEGVGGVTGADGAQGGGFGNVLTKAIEGLEATQGAAAEGSAALAAGTAESVESVVMAVEKAKLTMQMASTLRTRGVEALTTIMHTQI